MGKRELGERKEELPVMRRELCELTLAQVLIGDLCNGYAGPC